MILVSWNCNGRFREKYQEILALNADIYVIQECENPDLTANVGYQVFAQNHCWIGENKNKGLGVFWREGLQVTNNNWPSYCLRYFLSFNIENQFNLLGVWACKPYIAEYYLYQAINIERYKQHDLVIMGDFNSNKIWDRKNDSRSHGAVVKELQDIGVYSVYHKMYHEGQGEETAKTFFQYRHKDKGYHIDHCFTSMSNIRNYRILPEDKWLQFSDHVPIMLEL